MKQRVISVLFTLVVIVIFMLCNACGAARVVDPPASGDINSQTPDPSGTPAPDPVDNVTPADKPDDQAVSDQDPASYNFSFDVWDDSFRHGGSAASFEIETSFYDGSDWEDIPWNGSGGPLMLGDKVVDYIVVDILAVDAVDLKELYGVLTFENQRLDIAAQFAPLVLHEDGADVYMLTPPVGMLYVSDHADQVVVSGAFMHADEIDGFTGDGVVLQWWFGINHKVLDDDYPNWVYSESPVAPQLEDCRPALAYDETGGALRWGYNLRGDFNQNGVVDQFDVAEVARLFEDQATGLDSIAGFLTGTADGTVWLDAITTVGQHHLNALDGFEVYRGTAADYPAGGTLIGSVAFSAALGDPVVERRYFEFALTPVAGLSYWVKPVYQGETGIPSEPLAF